MESNEYIVFSLFFCKDDDDLAMVDDFNDPDFQFLDEWNTGKSLLEAPIFAEHGENMLCTRCGTVVRDFESEAKTRCNFQF